ncbi:TPA: glycosyltransferase family 2 protein [Vibrio cholerae]|uniref:glycosyltransferase family 2 protein n=1 Tax=Vibrio cholerae TaxID=666 RepID=UPI0028DA9AFF|nr:glycosyltransferase family 2 protein [Vibrio cholerae]
MTNKILVSIIIPHFNSFKKLLRLVATIPDDNRIEVIIVDDNSEEKIESVLFNGRSNVKLFLNTGKKGAGSSRNIGLKNCTGQWLLFADADDYFTEGAFTQIFEDVSNYNNDIIFYRPSSWNEDNGVEGNRHYRYEKLVLDYIEKPNKNETLNIRIKFLVPWSKLIKKELVTKNNIKFDEVMFSNDVMFSVQVGLVANSIKASKSIIYCVTENNSSLTRNKSLTAFETRLDVMFRFNDYLKEKGKHSHLSPLISYLFWARKFGFYKFSTTLIRMIVCRQRIIPKLKLDYIIRPYLVINKIKGL